MFLSHSKKNNRDEIFLVDHLLCVANRSRLLIKDTKFDASDTAFYSGLLHDVGKLNPWYQLLLQKQNSEDELDKKYVRKHSIFSAWIAYHLLRTRAQKTINADIMCSCRTPYPS